LTGLVCLFVLFTTKELKMKL